LPAKIRIILLKQQFLTEIFYFTRKNYIFKDKLMIKSRGINVATFTKTRGMQAFSTTVSSTTSAVPATLRSGAIFLRQNNHTL
jgi:hypothetical protein